MAVWSQGNIERLKNATQLKGQASQARFQGGQLLQQGIGQLGQGVQSGLDFLQTERERKMKEEQAIAERASREEIYDKGLEYNINADKGLYDKERIKALSAGPGGWYQGKEYLHGWEPKGYGDKDKEKEDLSDPETAFNNITGDWAVQGTIKGKDGQNITYSTDGRIQDWKNVDFTELTNRLKTWVEYKNESPANKKTALAYVDKWIQYRMRNALEMAINNSKESTGNLWNTVLQAADIYLKTAPGPLGSTYNQYKTIANPPKNNNELVSAIMNAVPGTGFVDQLLRMFNKGGQPDYMAIIPEKSKEKSKEKVNEPQRELPGLVEQYGKYFSPLTIPQSVPLIGPLKNNSLGTSKRKNPGY